MPPGEQTCGLWSSVSSEASVWGSSQVESVWPQRCSAVHFPSCFTSSSTGVIMYAQIPVSGSVPKDSIYNTCSVQPRPSSVLHVPYSCGSWIMAPNSFSSSFLQAVTVGLPGKRDFVDVLKLKVFRWGYYPGLSDGPGVRTRVLIKTEGGRKAEGGGMWRLSPHSSYVYNPKSLSLYSPCTRFS